MKKTIKTAIWQGIIIPSLGFILYGIICWKSDPFGIVLTDVLVKIPIAFIALKLLQKFRPIEKNTMSRKYTAIMLAVFAVAVCIPAQLMSHATATIYRAGGLEMIPKSLVTAPILEEIVYRGIIFGISRIAFGFWPATIVSAVWFQFAHITADYAIITVPVTIATACIYELTGNIRYNIMLHAVFNFCAFLFALIKIPVSIALPIYAASMALLLIAVAKRGGMAKILCISEDVREKNGGILA